MTCETWNTFLDWFRSHEPFDGNVPQLRSLASVLASSEGDGINSDETEKVGSEMQQSLDSVSVRNATIKRRQMVHTLNELKPGSRWISKLYRTTLQSCSALHCSSTTTK